jgi:hypothetical protein
MIRRNAIYWGLAAHGFPRARESAMTIHMVTTKDEDRVAKRSHALVLKYCFRCDTMRRKQTVSVVRHFLGY